MARIELRNTIIRIVDGYSNTAAVNKTTPAVADTTWDIDTLGTSEVVPLTARFTVVGSTQVYTITAQDANAILSIDLGGATGGTFTITVAGNTSSTIAYDANLATILAAIEAISGVSSGDFTVTGAGTAGDPYLVKAVAAGTFGDTAVVLSADGASLTGGTGIVQSQTQAGGATHNITFTPAVSTGNAPADNAVITITGRTLQATIGEGNLTYTESREYSYDLDRGNLDTVRELDQQPMDVSLDFTWEFLKAISGATTPTIEETFKKTGAAASWESSSADACEPYAVDIEIEHTPNCSTDQIETILLPDFRYESLDHDVDAASVAVSGRCNATSPTITRRAQ